jgi:hypothetical protein
MIAWFSFVTGKAVRLGFISLDVEAVPRQVGSLTL